MSYSEFSLVVYKYSNHVHLKFLWGIEYNKANKQKNKNN